MILTLNFKFTSHSVESRKTTFGFNFQLGYDVAFSVMIPPINFQANRSEESRRKDQIKKVLYWLFVENSSIQFQFAFIVYATLLLVPSYWTPKQFGVPIETYSKSELFTIQLIHWNI